MEAAHKKKPDYMTINPQQQQSRDHKLNKQKERVSYSYIIKFLVMNSQESRHSMSEFATSLKQSPSTSPSSSSNASPRSTTTQLSDKGDPRRGSSLAYRIKDHVTMGPKLSDTMKWKLRLGAKIIQEGGRENIFKKVFKVAEGEELLKASQCYLSTTSGPIAGLLFISTHKVAFCSDRTISFHSASGESMATPYKVVIPVRKIKAASQSENVDKPEQKFIEVVTEDDYEFWFMGFLRYEKAFKNLEKAISMSSSLVSGGSSFEDNKGERGYVLD